jgi:hypothetical protein
MKYEEVEHKKQVDQESIRLNNKCTISPTNDEEMRLAHGLRDDNSSSDEFQSVQLNVTASCTFWNICL